MRKDVTLPVRAEKYPVMSDQEVICAHMEPMPPAPKNGVHLTSRWWVLKTAMTGSGVDGCFAYVRVAPLIDVCPAENLYALLYEVEETLNDAQWKWYEARMRSITGGSVRQLVHASVPQKIEALASVLRTTQRRSE